MNIKNILVGVAVFAVTSSVFADDVKPQATDRAAIKFAEIIPNGMVRAPGPSLVYFSDASYPVQPQEKSKLTRTEVKENLARVGSK